MIFIWIYLQNRLCSSNESTQSGWEKIFHTGSHMAAWKERRHLFQKAYNLSKKPETCWGALPGKDDPFIFLRAGPDENGVVNLFDDWGLSEEDPSTRNSKSSKSTSNSLSLIHI